MFVLPLVFAIVVLLLSLSMAARRWRAMAVLMQIVVPAGLSLLLLWVLLVLAGYPLQIWSVMKPEHLSEWFARKGFAIVAVWLGIVALVMTLVVQGRHIRRRATLDLLTLAIEKQMPLPAVLRAFAADQWFRDRLLRLADKLERGVSLSAAIQADGELFSRDVNIATQMGEATGNLATAFRQARASDRLCSPLRQVLLGHIFYLVSLSFFVPMMFAFVAIYIVPKYISIFDDIGADLPNLTVLGVRFIHFYYWIGILMPVIGVVALIWMILCFSELLPLPRLGWGRRFERGRLLRTMALAAESQRPLGETLNALAKSYPRRGTGRRLQACRDETRAGANWNISLLKHGLIGVQDAALIEAAERLGNLPWALREVADGSDRRVIYRFEAALGVVSPLVMLGWGVAILLFAVACFSPIVKVISSLSQ